MSDPVSAVRQRIRGLLVDLFGAEHPVHAAPDEGSLRAAGVSSTGLVRLLVAMEDTFSFEWDDEVRPEVLRSIDSLAGHVVAVRG
ncbi:phosphopantetheine-binding protein [Streptomyces tagetis]|uniref:Carrier domain-containing protein n=1 Tax=Streptomyces tagetis TaxID=2820809 RepID=A0A940XG89_9ACTN|nr:phosphopantetheine-binding protein [Streptomyces sp. RG38]MBQ0826577.1 hypothetical protein [Streptomyces sp. RG38]